jgi:hypothetical protein
VFFCEWGLQVNERGYRTQQKAGGGGRQRRKVLEDPF